MPFGLNPFTRRETPSVEPVVQPHERTRLLQQSCDDHPAISQQEALAIAQDDEMYAEAASEAPSSPGWRERRLRGIGESRPIGDSGETGDIPQPMVASEPNVLYGATRVKAPPRTTPWRQGSVPTLMTGRRNNVAKWSGSWANLMTPTRKSLPAYFHTLKRQPSAYDSPLAKRLRDDEDHRAEKVNGIRVWYSSFQSIDWLHDSIKDVARLRRLRRKKSLRGRFLNALDRLSGWAIVSLVGFLSAVAAFLIVKSERWLFDLKEGHCAAAWWRSFDTCCATAERDMQRLSGAKCKDWMNWDEVFVKLIPRDAAKEAPWMIEYISFTFVALLLAFLSAVLTINLSASSSFVTRKDSSMFTGSSFAVNPPPRRDMFYAAGSGIPEIKTILSGFVIHGYLGGRTLFTKAVGLALSVASGLSLGKEGPMVHIASCIGNIISRFFVKYENNEGKRRGILSAASAAGVAVAFGAPIGGVLFSLEEVSYFFPPKVMWRSFFGAMIAAVTLKMLDPFGTGKLVLFQVTYDKDWHAFELFVFLVLGVFGGMYGAYFSKLNYLWSKHVRNGTWLKSHPISEVLLVTFVTALLSFLNPYTRMGGTELVYNLLAECNDADTHGGLCVPPDATGPVMKAIAVALLVKGILTIVTFGIKVPAGIFIPTLGVGACFGRICGLLMSRLQWRYPGLGIFRACGANEDCIIPGIYAMVGAAATLSGVTRTTVSLAVIMFELTDTLTYTVPVMLAILVAKTVADALEPKGIYDLVIDLSQLPYLDAKHQYLWGGVRLLDAIDRNVDVILVDQLNSVESLSYQVAKAMNEGQNEDGFPVVCEDNERLRLIGYIGLNELEHALSLAADNATGLVHFKTVDQSHRLSRSRSISSSLFDAPGGSDPLDFTVFMDKAPLTVQVDSPLELVQQMFVKLGARYVVVVRTDGSYEGVISKKQWLAFLSEVQ